MKKNAIVSLFAACAILLGGCAGQTANPSNPAPRQPAAENQPQEPPKEEIVLGKDWRTWGIIDAVGTLHIDGEDIGVCACVLGDRTELYLDEENQTLYRQIDYPRPLSEEQYEKATVEFDDYDGDGNTDVRVIVGDEGAPDMWWTWVWEPDDFVYVAALAYPPSMAAADASLQRYLSTITELHDSGRADRFALVYVDEDDVPELAAVSSEGAWDKEQTFLYTLSGDEPVLLASDIAPGMEGHSVFFCEGENFIVCSGAALGERLICCAIGANGAEQVLSLERIPNPADPDEVAYAVNGEETDEAQYLAALEAFAASHDTMIRLDIEEMRIVSLAVEDGDIAETVVGTIPYQSFETIVP